MCCRCWVSRGFGGLYWWFWVSDYYSGVVLVVFFEFEIVGVSM